MDRPRPRPRQPRRDPPRSDPRPGPPPRGPARLHGLSRARRAGARPGRPHGEVVSRPAAGRSAAPLFHAALAAVAADATAQRAALAACDGPLSPRRHPRRAGAGRPRADRPRTADRPSWSRRIVRSSARISRGAALSVSQAGYNTVLELVAHRVRAVVVPYEGSGDEQPLRARLLAERGSPRVVARGGAHAAPPRGGDGGGADPAAIPGPGPPRSRRGRPVRRDPGELARGVRGRAGSGRRAMLVAVEAVGVPDLVGGGDRGQAPRGIERHGAIAEHPGARAVASRASGRRPARWSALVLGPPPQARSRWSSITRPWKRALDAPGPPAPSSRSPTMTRSGGGPRPRVGRELAVEAEDLAAGEALDQVRVRAAAAEAELDDPARTPGRAVGPPGRCCRAGRSSARCGSRAGSLVYPPPEEKRPPEPQRGGYRDMGRPEIRAPRGS